MIRDKLIRLTKAVTLGAVILSLHWAFVLTTVVVFELKVAQDHWENIFYLSFLWIFVILGGALVVNVILNLSKITESMSSKQEIRPPGVGVRRLLIAIALSFPLIAGLLFLGDHKTRVQKQVDLMTAAEVMLTQHRDDVDHFTAYRFDRTHLLETVGRLGRLKGQDKTLPNLSIIQRDEVDGKTVFLRFTDYAGQIMESRKLRKLYYLYPCSKEQHQYLTGVFENGRDEPSFSISGSNYRLFYPAEGAGGRVVLYFTKRS